MTKNSPVRFIIPKVKFIEYLPDEHLAVVSPEVLGTEAIRNDIRWDSRLIISANLLGYSYVDYASQHNVEVEVDGIPYIKKFDSERCMWQYCRIKVRKPKIVTSPSYSELISDLWNIVSDTKSAKLFKTNHLDGLIYDEVEDSDSVMVQTFTGDLIYTINKRYLQLM